MDSTTRKGFGILEILAVSDEPRGVSELARETGFTRSNVQRILMTLCELGYAEKHAPSGRYQASLRQWEIGVKVLVRSSIVRAARAELLRLRATTGESAVLCLLVGGEILYVNKLESDAPIRMSCSVGTRLPLYATATGRVIAAHLSHEARMDAVSALPNEWTAQDFQNQLERIRTRGYEISLGSFRKGVNSVAAPIWQSSGVEAAIAISGPEERMAEDELPKRLPAVLDAASRISEALGHTGTHSDRVTAAPARPSA